jgi:Flp pilus assembly pilin Flp
MIRRDAIGRRLAQLLRDEHGGELLEYSIVAGMISIIAITIIARIGGRIAAEWAPLDQPFE